MKKILINNLLIFFFLTILLLIFLEFLNFKFSGVPIYDKLKIDRNQLTQIKSRSEEINKKFIPIVSDPMINKFYIEKCGYQESGIYHMVWKPDIYGFRENNKLLYKKTDIILLGDSFTYSACVNKPYDLKSQLEKIINKKVLNLSISGSGPIEQLKIIKQHTLTTEFDYFIWVFYEGNDHNQLKDKKIKNFIGRKSDFIKSKDEILVDYKLLRDLQKQYPEEAFLDYGWKNEKFTKFKIFMAEKLRGLNTLLKYFKSYPNIPYNKKYDELLKEMEYYLSQKKITKKYIYYLPKYTRLVNKNKNHPEIEYLNQIKKYVKTAAIKYNFEFIDGSTFFYNRIEPLDIFHYSLPTHLNENGYKLQAEHIKSYIKDN